MSQRTIRRFAMVAAGALLFTMFTGGTAAAAETSQAAVEITTLDDSRVFTAHSYFSNVYLDSRFDPPAQQWNLNPTGAPDTFFVANVGDGKCMRGPGEVIRGACGDTNSQWKLISHANGSVSFENVALPGQCVDVFDPPYSQYLQTKPCDASVPTQQYLVR